MNSDGGNQRRLSTALGADLYPSWAANGSGLIFASCRNFLDFDLYSLDVATGAQSQLNSWLWSNEWGAIYSPDGQYFAFNTDYEGNIEIYTVPAAGGTASNFTANSANDLAPTWTSVVVDVLSPAGRSTSPENGVTIGPGQIAVSAEAWDNPGGSGVARVEFFVTYDGVATMIGFDQNAPYNMTWTTPAGLHSQQIRFSVFVVDQAGNSAFGSGTNVATFLESAGDPGVLEHWVEGDRRAYLNQRSLPDGDSKCSAASMSMVLAMNSLIARDYATMAAKANEMYPEVLTDGIAYVFKMQNELRNQGATAAWFEGTVDQAWGRIKQEIIANRPVIVRTTHGVVTTAGHFVVAVGYRERGLDHQIIAYDPFGRWLGTCCTNNYDLNTIEAGSHKGQWVYYDFAAIFGTRNYLITAQAPSALPTANTFDDPGGPPDEISVEPPNVGTYAGVATGGGTLLDHRVYLPSIRNAR